MANQRNLFYGSLPSFSPKKCGENKFVPNRRFSPLQGADLDLRFSSPAVTACGGYVLWDRFLDRLGLPALLNRHARMDRGPWAFTAPELSRFFLDAWLLGAARLHHVDALRQDPLLTRAHGLDTLASDETLGRYFKAFSPAHLSDFDRLNRHVIRDGLQCLRRSQPRLARDGRIPIILDFDSTTLPTFGDKEEADRGRSFRHKDHPGFQPKFAFLGGLGLLLHQELCPQSVNLNKDFSDFEAATFARLPSALRVWAVRADGALYSEERLKHWERRGLIYAVSARRTTHLQNVVAQIPEQDWLESIDEDGHHCSLARLRYRPKNWETTRTYVVSRRLKNLRGQALLFDDLYYDYFVYVTNYRRPTLEQFKFCVERCSLESGIKEAKNGLHLGALPHAQAHANRAFLGHVQLAYNLLILWKVLTAPPEVNRWTVDTLRARILNVPANLIRRGQRWVLSLPRRWPWQYILLQLAETAPP